MADEEQIQNQNPEQQQTDSGTVTQPDGEKEREENERRFAELTRRNKELEKIVNMDQRLQNQEVTTQQMLLQQQNQQQRPQETVVDEQARATQEWLRQQTKPFFDEIEQRNYQRSLVLADQNDLAITMMEHPDYRDPEVQSEVEMIRKQRLQATGRLESRRDVMNWRVGQKMLTDPEYRKKELQKMNDEQETRTRGARGGARLETDAPIGSPQIRPPKPAEDMSIDEMEKFMSENKMRF